MSRTPRFHAWLKTTRTSSRGTFLSGYLPAFKNLTVARHGQTVYAYTETGLGRVELCTGMTLTEAADFAAKINQLVAQRQAA